jgi:transcriptional regulator with XRE-family HTH domain
MNTQTVPKAEDATLLETVLDGLKERNGDMARISRRTGLDYSWLTKLAQGRIKDPGVKKIERLAKDFEAHPPGH